MMGAQRVPYRDNVLGPTKVPHIQKCMYVLYYQNSYTFGLTRSIDGSSCGFGPALHELVDS